jgi:hypothetical protein
MLYAFAEALSQDMASEPLLDCDHNDLFRFASDLGELAASHTHLQVARDTVGAIIMNVKGQNRVDYYTILGHVKASRLIPILSYYEQLGLIKLQFEDAKYGLRLETIDVPSDSIIQKALVSMEATEQWQEHREPNLILAYVMIRGLSEALQAIDEKGTIELGEGITRLYVVNGHVYIPKQFTAPLVFILGSWANGENEFTDTKLNSFLTARGLSSYERDRVMRVIAGTNPGIQHTIYRTELFSYGEGPKSFRYVLNPRFSKLRDRFRSRMR